MRPCGHLSQGGVFRSHLGMNEAICQMNEAICQMKPIPIVHHLLNSCPASPALVQVLEQAGKDPRNASLEKSMSDTCIVQDHEKAYIMTVLDAPIGSLNAAKATGHPDGSDLIRGVAADPILVQHGGAGSSDALLLNGGEGGSGDDDADELEYIDELVDGGNKAFSGRGPEMVALQGVLQP